MLTKLRKFNRGSLQLCNKLKYIWFSSSSPDDSSVNGKIRQFKKKNVNRTLNSSYYPPVENYRTPSNREYNFQSNSSGRRPEDFYDSSSIRNYDNISRIERQRKEYFKHCNILINLSEINSTPLTAATLCYLPNHCFELNDDKNFVKYVLQKWYFALKKEMDSNRVPIYNLSTCFGGLAKINNTTNGDLVKILGPENLLTLTNFVLDSCAKLEAKFINIFCFFF